MSGWQGDGPFIHLSLLLLIPRDEKPLIGDILLGRAPYFKVTIIIALFCLDESLLYLDLH